MKINPATGRTVCKYHWEDKISDKYKPNIQVYRAEYPDSALGELIQLLDQIEETQGGQLALQGVEAPPLAPKKEKKR